MSRSSQRTRLASSQDLTATMISPSSTFLDSSSWNTNQQPAASYYNSNITPSAASGGQCFLLQHGSAIAAGAVPQGGSAGGGGDGSAVAELAKPMSTSERARLAGFPQPKPGLKCPRCDSTNTKFCYFNNYSLAQPRHFCRACGRHWTFGGVLRDIPVGSGYRRYAKRAKPKAAAATVVSASGMERTSHYYSSSTAGNLLAYQIQAKADI